MACATSCRTRDHSSYGSCLRSQNVGVMGLESTGNDLTKQKRWDRELQSYRDARAEGLQPEGTTHKQIDAAKRTADAWGTATKPRIAA